MAVLQYDFKIGNNTLVERYSNWSLNINITITTFMSMSLHKLALYTLNDNICKPGIGRKIVHDIKWHAVLVFQQSFQDLGKSCMMIGVRSAGDNAFIQPVETYLNMMNILVHRCKVVRKTVYMTFLKKQWPILHEVAIMLYQFLK